MRLRADITSARIDPKIYGHFAEHLGRCIYDGIWVGEESAIPNEGGLRSDSISAFSDLSPPILRWPGGCFADNYHFEDGIGPREDRPRRWNLWWNQEESNQFGTDEFIRFCRLTGAEPFICLNVGSGSVQEALNWMEYCNGGMNTHYADMRRRYGSAEPYGVKYWAIGNENWGCGGSFTPEDYGKLYRRFATYLRRFDGSAKFIACGHTTRDWNERFFDGLGDRADLVDYLSIHHYFSAGGDISFTDGDYFNLLHQIGSLEGEIKMVNHLIEYFSRGRKKIWIALDEWGIWHPQAVVGNGLYQQNTLRDAIFAASVLNLLNRHCDKVGMANIAQTFNVLQCIAFTDGPMFCLTPTYWVFHMFKGHMNGDLTAVELESNPDFKLGDREMPSVDVSASQRGKILTVTLVNRHLSEEIEGVIRLDGVKSSSVSARCLTGESASEHNTFDRPDGVKPTGWDVKAMGDEITVALPPRSVLTLEVKG
jgi:alpha-N-arabinofuranosidase